MPVYCQVNGVAGSLGDIEFNPTELPLAKRVEWRRSQTGSVVDMGLALRRQFSSGVDAVIIAVSPTPGWLELRQPNGRSAILIGLPFPVVQAMEHQRGPGGARDPLCPLRGLVKMDGKLGTSPFPIEHVSFVLPRVTWEVNVR